ncbi:MAG: hypothetical protein U1E63_16550 [Burkholderiales bacterium]
MLRAICLLAAAALAFDAGAAVTYRVDDGASMPYESNVLLRWRELVPSRANDNTVEGALVVAVRLNLAQWMNRNARLFLVLPQLDATSIRVTWTTQGRLLPGTIAPGNRVLVYSGPINTPLLEEALTLKIEADGTRFPDTRRLNFHFEIDLD